MSGRLPHRRIVASSQRHRIVAIVASVTDRSLSSDVSGVIKTHIDVAGNGSGRVEGRSGL